jgi:hypothetical protein
VDSYIGSRAESSERRSTLRFDHPIYHDQGFFLPCYGPLDSQRYLGAARDLSLPDKILKELPKSIPTKDPSAQKVKRRAPTHQWERIVHSDKRPLN